MMRNLVIEIELAEPAVCKMQLDFLAQPAFRAETVAIAHEQHPHHQLGIDRRATSVAIEVCQLLAQVSQHFRYDRIDPAQQMIWRNAIFEVEQIKKLSLIVRLPTHHDPPPPLNESNSSRESCPPTNHEPFFDSIGHSRHRAYAECPMRSVTPLKARRTPIPAPTPQRPVHNDASICTACVGMGCLYWLGPTPFRYPLPS